MEHRDTGHREGLFLFGNSSRYAAYWREICDAISSISDEMIIREFEDNAREAKSISQAINTLMKKELVSRGWAAESYIFADPAFRDERGTGRGTWRLDFAKDVLSVEVAFNHRSDISWNLIKPTLASELNHVAKAIQTDGGIIITATDALKAAGGFDSAVGTYEEYVQYLEPMYELLTCPLVIVGLEPPKSFRIEVTSDDGHHKIGRVKRL